MQLVLVMFRSAGDRRSFSVTRDVTIIGRREDCDLRIPVAEVSRKHCRILRDGDTVRMEDLGSSNGTFHNGQRLQSVELQAGDSLQVGPVVFVVQIDGVPSDEEMQPFVAAKAQSLSESVPVSQQGATAGAESAELGSTTDDSPEIENAEAADAGDADQAFAVASEESESTEGEDVNVDFGSEEAS